jgi:hypothetical protein
MCTIISDTVYIDYINSMMKAIPYCQEMAVAILYCQGFGSILPRPIMQCTPQYTAKSHYTIRNTDSNTVLVFWLYDSFALSRLITY